MTTPDDHSAPSPLIEAFLRSGFRLPDNIVGVRLQAAIDDAVTVQFTCALTAQQLAEFGQALAESANSHANDIKET